VPAKPANKSYSEIGGGFKNGFSPALDSIDSIDSIGCAV